MEEVDRRVMKFYFVRLGVGCQELLTILVFTLSSYYNLYLNCNFSEGRDQQTSLFFLSIVFFFLSSLRTHSREGP